MKSLWRLPMSDLPLTAWWTGVRVVQTPSYPLYRQSQSALHSKWKTPVNSQSHYFFLFSSRTDLHTWDLVAIYKVVNRAHRSDATEYKKCSFQVHEFALMTLFQRSLSKPIPSSIPSLIKGSGSTASNTAFQADDIRARQAVVQRCIRTPKLSAWHQFNSGQTRGIWQGLQTITNSKRNKGSVVNTICNYTSKTWWWRPYNHYTTSNPSNLRSL